jgi:3-methyladenine DNA glycosylase AlkD
VQGALVEDIRRRLRAAADPQRAPQMQAYMKSTMPYLGVRVPEVRRLTRAAAAQQPFVDHADLAATVRLMWDEAGYREERYAATALCDTASARAVRSAALLGLYQALIVSGAWWDHVDELAHRVGELLAGWPDEVRPVVGRWITDPDRWLRRAAILCQLGAKDRTDLGLLTAAIEANCAEPDFFLRKAIGWALRQHARLDPAWVRGYVDALGDRLSGLSRREATKHLTAPL